MQILTPLQKKARVGFIVPRWAPVVPPDGQGVPFRAVTVAGALLNAGYEIVWCDQEVDIERGRKIAEMDAALASASIVFFWMNELPPIFQINHVFAMAAEIKKRSPNLPIVCGGSAAAGHRAEAFYLDRRPVDYFVIGHGEETAPRLADALTFKTDLDVVPGIVFANDRRHTTPILNERLRPEHMSALTAMDLAPYIKSSAGIFGNGRSTLVVQTGRGCAKGCTFCYHSTFKFSGLRGKEIVDVCERLQQKWRVEQFHLAELDFMASKSRPLETAAEFEKRLPECRWFSLASPIDALRYSISDWDDLVRGGLSKIEFGSESGSIDMLRRLGKEHHPDDAIKLTDLLIERGVSVMHNFIFGVPGETERDRSLTLGLVARLMKRRPEKVFWTFRLFQPSWDSPLGEEAIAHVPGFPRTIEAGISYRTDYDDPHVRRMPWLSAEDERRVKDLCYHYLPLATGRHDPRPNLRGLTHRLLRSVARFRVRSRFFAAPLDEAVFRRFVKTPLDHTYTA